jgi:hypothetical protein
MRCTTIRSVGTTITSTHAATRLKGMTVWTRTFHNPFTKKSFEVTSDEQNLPKLRERIVKELQADHEWQNESIYVHENGLDHQTEGSHPDIRLKEL